MELSLGHSLACTVCGSYRCVSTLNLQFTVNIVNVSVSVIERNNRIKNIFLHQCDNHSLSLLINKNTGHPLHKLLAFKLQGN